MSDSEQQQPSNASTSNTTIEQSSLAANTNNQGTASSSPADYNSPPSLLVGPQPPHLLSERCTLLSRFQLHHQEWRENNALLDGDDGWRRHDRTREMVGVDSDFREENLKEVLRLYKEEMGCVAAAHDYDNENSDGGCDQEENQKDSKMKADDDDTNAALDAKTQTDALTSDQLADLLFSPGMRYRGYIHIPGIPAVDADASVSGRDSNNNINDGNSSSDNPNTVRAAAFSDNAQIANPLESLEPTRDGSYELTILKRETDALGNSYILAHHKAYDDEQCVHITVVVATSPDNNEELHIEYQDGETVCTGVWNTSHHRLEGNVCQRLQPNDGAFHSRSEITHVFRLYPCTYAFPLGRHVDGSMERGIVRGQEGRELTEARVPVISDDGGSFDSDISSVHTRAIVRHRNRTYTSLMKALMSLNAFFENLDIGRIELMQMQKLVSIFKDENKHPFNNDEIMGMLLKLRHTEWIDFLTAVSLYSEETSAELRRRAALLENECFETVEQRTDWIARWNEARMDLAGAHELWNDCEQLGKNICGLALAFDFGLVRDAGMYPLQVMRHRLMNNYYCFESAYKRAETRIASCDTRRYEITANILRIGLEGSSEENSMACPICLHVLLKLDDSNKEDDEPDDDVIYKLPCSHCFHGRCVKQWLHNHSSCPVCRADLNAQRAGPDEKKSSVEDSFVEEA